MFDILKKKISSFVDTLSGKLKKEEPEKKQKEKTETPKLETSKPILEQQEKISKPEPAEPEPAEPEPAEPEPAEPEPAEPEPAEPEPAELELAKEIKLEPMEEFKPEPTPESIPEVKKDLIHELKQKPINELKPEIKQLPFEEIKLIQKPVPSVVIQEPELTVPKEKTPIKTPEEKLPEVRTSIFGKIKSLVISDHTITGKDVDEALEELEVQLITSDVALAVAEAVVSDMKEKMVGSKVKFADMGKFVKETMLSSITDVMKQDKFDLLKFIEEKNKPVRILLVGPNGAGKTTTIAKLAHLLKKHGISSVMSASDTFRAAAIEQTEEHAKNVGVPVIKHQYGSDPAAVAFDAVKYAESHNIDVVLMDTAGRQETNKNLVEELKKIVRISKPDLKIFIGEGIVGNSIISQVSQFHEAIGLDGVILSKIDVDTKGGTIISVRKATGIPIFYIAVGQSYEDLLEFDPNYVISKLFS